MSGGKAGGQASNVSKSSDEVWRKDSSQLLLNLEDEGKDGRAKGRVVAELFQIAAVLPFGPDGHLDEAHQGEERHRETLGHQGEAKPGAQLIGVVGTGDQEKDPGEGVLGRIGNLPGF